MKDAEKRETTRKELVERAGVLMEQMGFPRMTGRVLGYLFIAEPPHQTFNEIQAYLQASKSSISTSLQSLVNQGLVVYFTAPGDRRRFFKLNADSWTDLIKKEIGQLANARKLILACLAVRSSEYAAFNESLMEISELYAFFEKELPALLGRWEQRPREK